MQADQSFTVSRINRFDSNGRLKESGAFDWIYSRVLAQMGDLADQLLPMKHFPSRTDGLPLETDGQIEWFRKIVDFNLLHEFTTGRHFDWHVDTKPNDGSGRTWNINVMLSAPRFDFTGGALQIGGSRLQPERGDLYIYSAAIPHRVEVVQSGQRYTLVIALTERRLGSPQGASDLSLRRQLFWAHATASYQDLTSGALSADFKVHILFGEHLEAEGDGKAARLQYCRAYRASREASASVQAFLQKGVEALQAANLPLGEQYFEMATCVQPEHNDAREALQYVRDAMHAASSNMAQQHSGEETHPRDEL
eukprot:CAMPEP_0119306848 /NCGR_PEP_ID=MMETSP1333-20130426/7509_1 /TAXON_ID=418940 /ORGANISM="Scyphosphaera apsteinii, Strain RCC1455" /LENGTH=308 /DNA_ID=CAMNT_0007310267 /DNA_START=235 /DNA_END=1161 /DNA_ORIENTATION=+